MSRSWRQLLRPGGPRLRRGSDIPGLLRTKEGRLKLRAGLWHFSGPLTRPAAGLYRHVVLKHTRIIAVVGSYGKTTTRAIAAAAVGDGASPRGPVQRSLFGIPPSHPCAVLEVGIDRPGQMAPIASILRADTAIVTSIGTEHITSLGTLENIRHEKAHMVRSLSRDGLAILNGDDPNVMWMAGETRAKVVTFGLGEHCDVRATDVRLEWPVGLSFLVHAGGESCRVRTKFLSRHFVPQFLSAAAAATSEGVALLEFARRVEPVKPVHGRMQIKQLGNGAVLLCDYYKSNYETMHTALDTLAEVPARRHVVVFGDVTEPPGSPATVYGGLGERIAKIADWAVFVGEGFRRYRAGAVRAGMRKEALFHAGYSVQAAAELLAAELGPGDVVLIKGRGTQKLDRIALALEGRTVKCGLVTCYLRNPRCAECSKLECGWGETAPVT